MTDLDHKLRRQLREESEQMLFSGMELSERVKQNIRRQAAAEKAGRRSRLRTAWIAGAAALAAAVIMLMVIPTLQQPGVPAPSDHLAGNLPPDGTEPPSNGMGMTAPSNGGPAAGSDLSELITTPLNSVDEAKAAFGEDLLAPGAAPEGFTLAEIAAVGVGGESARDVILTYAAGDKTVTFVASRNPAAFPVDMFAKTQVNGVDGFVFEQPELVELFWVEDGVQYAITGPLSADEAMKLAESVREQP